MDINYAKELINQVRKDYNIIAKDFSKSRSYFWESLQFLIDDYVKPGFKILDSGCGNGRLYELLKDKNIEYTGLDFSEAMINEARLRYSGVNFMVANSLNLWFPEKSFDIIYSFAVLHHIPSKELRLKFLLEAKRVLKDDGYFIITVWNLWANKKAVKLFWKNLLKKIFFLSKLDIGDIFYLWKNKNGMVLAQRYCHMFTEKELKNLFIEAGFFAEKIGIVKENQESNIFIVARKR